MEIITYKTYLDKQQHNFLIKESSTNYAAIENLKSPQNVCEIMKNVFRLHELAEEEVYLISLNSKGTPTGFFMIGKGTVNNCLVSNREIFIRALLSGAVNIILCHNHPSGETTPSKEDIKITKAVSEAGKLMGITLLDHIIIGGNSYYSFDESNLL